MKDDLTTIANIRRTHLGRYLFELNRAYKDLTMAYIQENGFSEMTPGYLSLLSQVDLLKPTGMKDLIKRAGLSKQAVSRTFATCEELGYVRRYSDSGDSRSTFIEFTAKGIRLMKVAADAIVIGEETFAAKLGKSNFKNLKSNLEDASQALNLVKVDSE